MAFMGHVRLNYLYSITKFKEGSAQWSSMASMINAKEKWTR